jgi:hypothetical protein
MMESWEKIGGAEGVRTPDLLDAIEARSQLRHGPTLITTFIALRDGERQTAAAPKPLRSQHKGGL